MKHSGISKALGRLTEPGKAIWHVNDGQQLDEYLKKPKRSQAATVESKVRMKEPLRAKIERSAKAHGISMNAEMVRRLERSFDVDDVNERLDRLEALIPQR